jgi:alpha-ketoglutarate-dependent taurine dioxygenase
MLGQVLSGRSLWQRKDFEASPLPRFHLDQTCQAELKQAVQGLHDFSKLLDIKPENFALPSCQFLMAKVRSTLDSGCGFAVVGSLDSYARTESAFAYWLLGRLLGPPFKQNVRGDFLYDVRDLGYSVKDGVRASVTAEETGFHTDYTFGDPQPDYVGLLCIQPATEGGLSQIVSAYSVHNALLNDDRDALETLYGHFHFDKRGEFLEGEAETLERPVFEYGSGTLSFRYMPEYIRSGHKKVGKALTTSQNLALNRLDNILKTPSLQVEFPLASGEMLWINNIWIAHNRTAFKDDQQQPEKKRHYVRLWIRRPRGEKEA